MKIYYPQEYILVADDFVSGEYCQSAIERLNQAEIEGYGITRKEDNNSPTSLREDLQFYAAELPVGYMGKELGKEFNERFWTTVYQDYAGRYGALNNLHEHVVNGSKYQKTSPTQGYHVWHCEHDKGTDDRIMAWILYLNDVEEGGETEFLYQSLRVQPKQGRFVMWPAFWTHLHRGNPPLSGDKYISTGWVEFN